VSPLGGAVRGALALSATGLAGFSLWAFNGRRLSEPALYAAIAGVFVLLPPLLMPRLVDGPRSRLRFATVFVPAFLAYAAVWCAAWFALRNRAAEWLGSAGGCLAFTLVAALRLGGWKACPKAFLALFALHSAGYFLGDRVFAELDRSRTGMLLWGVLYGAGLGAGAGWSLRTLQAPRT
jgi:hypothetical protein